MAVALAFSAMIIFLSLLFQIYICLNFHCLEILPFATFHLNAQANRMTSIKRLYVHKTRSQQLFVQNDFFSSVQIRNLRDHRGGFTKRLLTLWAKRRIRYTYFVAKHSFPPPW